MRFSFLAAIAACLVSCFSPGFALADESAGAAAAAAAINQFNSGDIAWMLISSALVLMMTAPGLALFYGGLVRKKNILGVMMQCITLMGVMSIIWALYGYSLCFGDSLGGNGFIGDFKYAFLNGVVPYWDSQLEVGVHPAYSPSLPRSIHMIFQMMFFIITPALICGAFAERMKFSAMLLFSILWGTSKECSFVEKTRKVFPVPTSGSDNVPCSVPSTFLLIFIICLVPTIRYGSFHVPMNFFIGSFFLISP